MWRLLRSLQRIITEPRPVRFCISRVFFYAGINIPFKLTFSKKPLVQTRLHASSAAHKLFIGKYQAYLDVAVFKHFIQTDSVVIDVGANIGLFSSLAGKLADEGKVYAVEATPKTYGFMQETIGVNELSNIVPVFGAVSDKKGELYLHDHKYSKEQNYVTSSPADGVAVPSFRLDDLITLYGIEEVTFLKVDVEGAELLVIKSLGSSISRTETIYFECLPETYTRYGYDASELFSYLRSNGYRLYSPRLDEEQLLFDELTDNSQLSVVANNLIATRKVIA